MHCMYCSLEKDIQAEAKSNSEKINPIALAIVGRQLVSQSVGRKFH